MELRSLVENQLISRVSPISPQLFNNDTEWKREVGLVT